MTWRRERDANGPAWRGVDSVLDAWWQRRRDAQTLDNLAVGAIIAALGLGACVCFLEAELHAPWGDQSWRSEYLYALLMFLAGLALSVATWLGCVMNAWAMPPPFITRTWTLCVNASGGLEYRAGRFSPFLDPGGVSAHGAHWSVTLDAISRVESCQTQGWQPARRYHGGPWYLMPFQLVSEHEFQTFLYLNDGSRRVIFTAVAARESCGTLAASIRAWLEEARAKSCADFSTHEREGFAL